ncbi:MAG: ATP-binding cassette domain-containing protein, partial [Verrucomicrobiia bacterium]
MPILEVSQLKKSYVGPDGDRQIVVDVAEFSLEAEQQLALSGESGTGKTTFLNLIAGILTPDSG